VHRRRVAATRSAHQAFKPLASSSTSPSAAALFQGGFFVLRDDIAKRFRPYNITNALTRAAALEEETQLST